MLQLFTLPSAASYPSRFSIRFLILEIIYKGGFVKVCLNPLPKTENIVSSYDFLSPIAKLRSFKSINLVILKSSLERDGGVKQCEYLY